MWIIQVVLGKRRPRLVYVLMWAALVMAEISLMLTPTATAHAAVPQPSSHRGYAWITQLVRLTREETASLPSEVTEVLANDGWILTPQGYERTKRLDYQALGKLKRTGARVLLLVGAEFITVSEHGSIASKRIDDGARSVDVLLVSARNGHMEQRRLGSGHIIHRPDGLADVELVSELRLGEAASAATHKHKRSRTNGPFELTRATATETSDRVRAFVSFVRSDEYWAWYEWGFYHRFHDARLPATKPAASADPALFAAWKSPYNH